MVDLLGHVLGPGLLFSGPFLLRILSRVLTLLRSDIALSVSLDRFYLLLLLYHQLLVDLGDDAGWLIGWLIGWLVNGLVNWLVDWLFYWLVGLLIS